MAEGVRRVWEEPPRARMGVRFLLLAVGGGDVEEAVEVEGPGVVDVDEVEVDVMVDEGTGPPIVTTPANSSSRLATTASAAIPPCPYPNISTSLARNPHSLVKPSTTPVSIFTAFTKPVSMSIFPLRWSKMMSSPQWKPGRENGSGVGACREMQTVSGRERRWERVVKGWWVSPRPWRRTRALLGVEVEGGGGVMVRVRVGGKSVGVGRRGGMVGGWGRCEVQA